jgi:hypothetical protein
MEFHSYAMHSGWLAGIPPTAMEIHNYPMRSHWLAAIALGAIRYLSRKKTCQNKSQKLEYATMP